MASNGRLSCTKRTKHIKNRYFMIKDKIGRGEVVIQYCPTGDMWADINTKALQGSLFYKMRARLMGIDENYHDDLEREPLTQRYYHRNHRRAELMTKQRRYCARICTLLAATKTGLSDVQRKTQAAVAALIFMRSMARGTQESSSHRRSVLGDKGCALRTVGKGVYKGPNPSPLDKRITDRRARIRNLRALHCCILSSRG